MNSVVLIIIVIGLAMLVAYGLVLLGIANVFEAGDDVSSRLSSYVAMPEETTLRRPGMRRRAGLVRWRLRLNNWLGAFASEKLNLQLVAANWPISATEYVLIRFWGTVIALVVGWLISANPLPGIGLAILAYIIPPVLLRQAITRRRNAFERQLVDVLLLVQGAVRAGYSFQQALDVVVREMKAPASEEFRRVRHEVGLGLSLSQALGNMVTRMENDDLYLVVTAININSQVGGNLVTMLDAVTNTIRDRVRLFSEVRVLTSQQRFSSTVLTFMPFGMAGLLFIITQNIWGACSNHPSICASRSARRSIFSSAMSSSASWDRSTCRNG
jgi:tight adherence protein B